jgi:hypothetical protein
MTMYRRGRRIVPAERVAQGWVRLGRNVRYGRYRHST